MSLLHGEYSFHEQSYKRAERPAVGQFIPPIHREDSLLVPARDALPYSTSMSIPLCDSRSDTLWMQTPRTTPVWYFYPLYLSQMLQFLTVRPRQQQIDQPGRDAEKQRLPPFHLHIDTGSSLR